LQSQAGTSGCRQPLQLNLTWPTNETKKSIREREKHARGQYT
jgi:hypothetical protein